MSIIDNLLVLLDDKKARSIDQISNIFNNYTKQVIAASLGRLVSKKLVNKSDSKYSITLKGQEIITDNLDNLNKIENNKSQIKFSFIIFNIPEKERINRDIFRNYLLKKGYGRLHNTVWISLHKDNAFNKYLSEIGISKNVLKFNVELSDKDKDNIINKTIWNFDNINTYYSKFLKYSKEFLSNRKNSDKDKVMARCLVYFYSKIISMDPMLSSKYTPSNYLGLDSIKIYNKIRNYCY